MKKTVLSLALVVLSIIGAIEAGFVTYQKMNGYVPPCLPGFNCAKVLYSPLINIGPFPIPVLGLIFYSLMFILTGWYFLKLESDPQDKQVMQLRKILTFMTWFGLGFAVYITILMGAIIKDWCTYCVGSAVVATLLFIVWNVLVRLPKQQALNNIT